MRLRDLAATRVRYGYRRLHVLLRREGWEINHKRVLRIYREEGLNLRTKRPRRRVAAKNREERAAATAVNENWSMDFMSEQLCDGRWIRVLTIVDSWARSCRSSNRSSKTMKPRRRSKGTAHSSSQSTSRWRCCPTRSASRSS